MKTKMGSGDYVYEELEDWGELPEGWSFKEVVDVEVDSQDRVYVFNRGEHPLIVFERDGSFVTAWGEGLFTRPHGLTLGPDENLYCADDDGHCVRKYTPDGRLLMTIGTPDRPAPPQSGQPFDRPTKVAFDPKSDDLYISDGYGNAKVHKFSPDGEHLFSWGDYGTDPGQFNLVHSVCTDGDGKVYIADRENHRVQIFDEEGNYLSQWNNLHRPCGLHIEGDRVYIGQIPTEMAVNADYPNLGACVSIHDLTGPASVPSWRCAAGGGPGTVYSTTRTGSRLARGPVCGRGILERLWPAAGSAQNSAFLPQAGQSRLMNSNIFQKTWQLKAKKIAAAYEDDPRFQVFDTRAEAKALIGALIAVFFLFGPVLAEGKDGRENERSFFVLGGYQYIKAAALQVGALDLRGIGGYAIILAGGIPLNPKVSFMIGFEGTEITSQIIDLGAVAELTNTRYSIPLLVRFYTSEPGIARGFIDVGPTVNFLRIKGSVTSLGTTPFSGSTTESKPGFTIKAGARFPLSKRYAFETVAGYNFVDKHNTVDMSSLLVVGGFGVVW